MFRSEFNGRKAAREDKFSKEGKALHVAQISLSTEFELSPRSNSNQLRNPLIEEVQPASPALLVLGRSRFIANRVYQVRASTVVLSKSMPPGH